MYFRTDCHLNHSSNSILLDEFLPSCSDYDEYDQESSFHKILENDENLLEEDHEISCFVAQEVALPISNCLDNHTENATPNLKERNYRLSSSSSSSSSASSLYDTTTGKLSTGDDHNYYEHDTDFLDFPFDLFENESLNNGDILDTLQDVMWYDATGTPCPPFFLAQYTESEDDSTADTPSSAPVSSSPSPSMRTTLSLNMDKLDECMQRSAESRSMIKKMATMIPMTCSSSKTVGDSASRNPLPIQHKFLQTGLGNVVTVVPSLQCTISSSSSLVGRRPYVGKSNVMLIRGQFQREERSSTSKITKKNKKTKAKKCKKTSDYICSGVLLKERVIPTVSNENNVPWGRSNLFNTGIYQIRRQKESRNFDEPTTTLTQSISSFLKNKYNKYT